MRPSVVPDLMSMVVRILNTSDASRVVDAVIVIPGGSEGEH